MKKWYRSVLSLVLVAIALLSIGCSSAPVAKGPLYSPEQLAQIEKYVSDVDALRVRMQEIPPLVQKKQWVDVQTFIHGPLGELRAKMTRLARLLEPEKAQPAALDAAKAVFGHLTAIDEATETGDSQKALLNYNEALRDFQVFLDLMPTTQDG
ncbi:photosystem II protein PsbQ [Thermoleptolyngbya sp.]|jgi:photosystem II protein PsbQ